MTIRALRLGAVALALAAAAPSPPALAGDEVPGKWYENRLVGFRFRPLNEWAAIPPGTDPRDTKICGFYCDAAKFSRGLKPECSVYAFKQTRSEGVATPSSTDAKPPSPPEGPPANPTPEDLARLQEQLMDAARVKSTRAQLDLLCSRIKAFSDQALAGMEEKKRKKLLSKIKVMPATEREEKPGKEDEAVLTTIEAVLPFPVSNDEVIEVHLLAGFIRNEDYEAGVIYEIPGSEWKKYGQGCMASLRSLEFLSSEDIAAARQDLADALVGKTGDERWIEEIKRKVGPGWAYLQTRNYLVVYDKVVKPDRVKLIALQIEAIRKDVYEVMFPPDRPLTAISVVRVCKDKDQYVSYGGSPSSAGYWNPGDKELVFYEDTGAKKDSLRVLNHEAFHQYIFYSVGSISPHDWFNEGHGDYFAGHNFDRSGKFIPKPFSWRQGEIKNAMGTKKFIPLRTFVEYTHAQYYGPLIGQNYAQGWSLIWFLRGTRNPEWKGILETYFNTLKGEVTRWVNENTRDGQKPSFTPDDVEKKARDMALDSVFGGWDDRKWARFEKEWLDFKY